jgi:hypothetical protein
LIYVFWVGFGLFWRVMRETVRERESKRAMCGWGGRNHVQPCTLFGYRLRTFKAFPLLTMLLTTLYALRAPLLYIWDSKDTNDEEEEEEDE